MLSTRPSLNDERHILGILLIAALFFSWITGLKNLVADWTDSSEASDTASAPNVLMIVVDDMGYDDHNAINPGGLHTPHIKDLAEAGVTFRRHYADATCTPSRVGMLTGRDPERSGFRPVGIEIPSEFSTLAEQLREVGYATYLTGKWHAGEERLEAWPQNKGFDSWFGFLNQWELSGPVTEATKGVRKPRYNNPMLRTDGGELEQHPGHLTDLLTEHTIAKIVQLQAGEKPWFLYHAFLAPHHPIQPAARFAAKFPDTPEGRYTALVTQLDEAIGRILKATNQDNTLVVFVSDNGGTNVERNNNYPFFGKKSETFEGSYRTPLVISWPGKLPANQFVDDIVMNVDIYPTILAAAGKVPPTGLDGRNLWPLMHNGAALEPRSRSWEVFAPNINALSLSFLDPSGEWRLSGSQGFPPGMQNLHDDPTGGSDVASRFPGTKNQLMQDFWQEQWRKSHIEVLVKPGKEEKQTLYTGYDATRSPFRYGFSIGLEIGPLDNTRAQQDPNQTDLLAGQDGIWSLRYRPNHGLEWQIGDTTLRDASFEPASCNRVVLTGYLQPMAHLAKRDPLSQVKLYSAGSLRDSYRGFDFASLKGADLSEPTFVNHSGRALFANIMLSTFGEEFSPRLAPKLVELYTALHRNRELPMPEVRMMDKQLCKKKIPAIDAL